MNTLQSRGILEAANQYGWHEKSNRWHYPVYALDGSVIGTRTKRISGNAPKYLWHPSKPDHEHSDWYILPETAKAIAKADGVVYLANGEASVLAHITATVYNTIATTLSEVSVPSNTIEVLNTLGVTRVIYLADHDDAGCKSAIKWRDAISGSGVDFEARGFDDNRPEHFDTGDLWQAVGFDAEVFKARLVALPTLSLPLAETTQNPTHTDYRDFDSTPQGLIDAMASALQVKRWKQNGWCANVSSPFREDKKPSFGIHRDSGTGIDFGTGETFSPTQIADALGIDWRRFYPETINVAPKRRVVEHYEAHKQSLADEPITLGFDPKRTSWINQPYLPLSWVRAVMYVTRSNSAVAPIMYKLHHSAYTGAIDATRFTISQILKVLDVPRKSTTAAIETLEEWGFVSKVLIYNNIDSTDRNDTKGGRPPTYYQISERDSGIVQGLLYEMCYRKTLEDHSKKTIAPRVKKLAEEIGITEDALSQWQARTDQVVDKHSEYTIKKLFVWWNEQLADNAPLILEDFGNARDMRVDMLCNLLDENAGQIQESNSVLALLLGCSESNLSNIYKAADCKSLKRHEFWDIKDAKTCTLDDELKDAARKFQGVPVAILIKWYDADAGKTKTTSPRWGKPAMFSAMAELKDKMVGAKIMVSQPSVVRYMTDDELAPEEVPQETDTEAPDTVVVTEKPKKPRKKRYPQSGKADRNYSTFDKQWIIEQLQAEAFLFTDNEAIPHDKLGAIPDAIRWLNENAHDKPVRTIEELHQQDDETSTLIDLGRFLGGEVLSDMEVRQRNVQVDIQPIAEVEEPEPQKEPIGTWDYPQFKRVEETKDLGTKNRFSFARKAS